MIPNFYLEYSVVFHILFPTGEINAAGERLLVANGGAGGNHYNGFCGQKDLTKRLTIDLKTIADIGLVG